MGIHSPPGLGNQEPPAFNGASPDGLPWEAAAFQDDKGLQKQSQLKVDDGPGVPGELS